jgi:phosphoserine/homoserine phosphotransferase
VSGYHVRLTDHKRRTVAALRALNFRTIAAGDSYNDTAMLAEADAGILFHPPQSVIAAFPQFPVAFTYDELKTAFLEVDERLGTAA